MCLEFGNDEFAVLPVDEIEAVAGQLHDAGLCLREVVALEDEVLDADAAPASTVLDEAYKVAITRFDRRIRLVRDG